MSGGPTAVRLLESVLVAGNRLATLEIVAMGARMGLSLEAMTGVINKGSGRNVTTAAYLTGLATGQAQPATPLAPLVQDLGRAMQLAMACGAPAILTSTVRGLAQACAQQLPPQADLHAATAVIEAMAGAGVTSRPPQPQPAAIAAPGALRIGYVGLGAMGGALARRLLLTHPVRVYDQRAEVAQALQEQGALTAPDLPALARACDVIFLCVPNSKIVREIVFGDGGLAAGLAPGKVIVDQTTGDPAATRAIAAALAKLDVALVDAPVSGGPRGAVAGTISIMCGGSPAAYGRVRPLLEAISPNIVHCGDIGNGHVAKLVNNAVASCNRALVYEVAAIAVRHGITLAELAGVVNAGPAASSASERILPGISQGKGTSDFQLQLMVKDLRLAADMAVAAGTPMLVAGVVRGLFEAGVHSLGGAANLDEMAGEFARRAGVRFEGA